MNCYSGGCGCKRCAENRRNCERSALNMSQQTNLPVLAFIKEQPSLSGQNIYSPEKALCTGTLFPLLNKPFEAAGGCKK